MREEPDYFYFASLFEDKKFKSLYREKCNEVSRRMGQKLGLWKLFKKNKEFGIIDKNDEWCWRNTINTHPYCFYDLWYFYKEQTGDSLDFDNPLYWTHKINRLWSLVEKNWDLLFTDNIDTKYYHNFRLRCNKSWTIGQITTIAFICSSQQLFPELKRLTLKFDLGRGDTEDFKGKDIVIGGFIGKSKKKTLYSIQIKNGVYDYSEYLNGFYVKGSVNDLTASCEYYSYISMKDDITKIILLKNDKNLIKREFGEIYFPDELFDNRKMEEHVLISEKLMEIATFCFNNKIVINIINEGETNTFSWDILPEKVLNLTLGDFKDVNLPNLLSERFELFKSEI